MYSTHVRPPCTALVQLQLFVLRRRRHELKLYRKPASARGTHFTCECARACVCVCVMAQPQGFTLEMGRKMKWQGHRRNGCRCSQLNPLCRKLSPAPLWEFLCSEEFPRGARQQLRHAAGRSTSADKDAQPKNPRRANILPNGAYCYFISPPSINSLNI